MTPPSPKSGKVFLVGAGPGDPGLLTRRAVACLTLADVVIYDRLVSKAILDYAPRKAEFIYAGKVTGKQALAQDEINRLMVERARRGKTVVRLKGGDPFIFGRGGEEALCVAASGIPFEVVPGISAATAVPAYAGIPLTMRGVNTTITIVTGHEAAEKGQPTVDWNRLASDRGTLVFLMGVGNLSPIADALIAHGMDGHTPAAVVMWGATPRQKTVTGTLQEIAKIARAASIEPPATVVVGHVVALRKELAWFEKRPLFGKSILVTRASHQAAALAVKLQELGAYTEAFPAIAIRPPSDYAPLDHILETIDEFDWILFTSTNAVHVFFERFFAIRKDIRELKGIRIGSIGERTREALERYRIQVDLCPPSFTSTGLLKEVKESHDIRGQRVLLPRSNLASSVLAEGLKQLGAAVVEIDLYTTAYSGHVDQEVIHKIAGGKFDIVTFTSSSTVRGFVETVGKQTLASLPPHVRFASIGPVTSRTAARLGISIAIEAKEHTIDGLVEAIVTSES